MRFDFQCNDGSPIGVIPSDIQGRGVGGAELALLSLTEALASLGHEVWIYNDPREPVRGPVHFATKESFYDGHASDVFVLFRSPNPALRKAHTRIKLFWSCDQYTIGDYRREIFPFVDWIVAISQYHRTHHIKRWGADPDRIGSIDLGVRLQEYEEGEVSRNPHQLIFCSVPDRGLDLLHEAWLEIKKQVPQATLTITGDYRLWGSKRAGTHQFKLKFGRQGSDGVSFLGRVPRARLVKEQRQSALHTYPCSYEELFCISVAECQVAGAIPITPPLGALGQTNQWGFQIEGDARTPPWKSAFVGRVIESLSTDLSEQRTLMMKEARKRFDWTKIANDWIRLIELGRWPGEEV